MAGTGNVFFYSKAGHSLSSIEGNSKESSSCVQTGIERAASHRSNQDYFHRCHKVVCNELHHTSSSLCSGLKRKKTIFLCVESRGRPVKCLPDTE
ncbi:hypothetical protein TNCV_3959791 [Trichonephila clavipes]|nr:hypothetical protein TNCV_3959791 [Trichonephila clavipes]